MNRRVQRLSILAVASLLAWPATGIADDVTITLAVSASIKKLTPHTAHVKVSWGIACNGKGSDPVYNGNLKLVDLANAEETYLGGVFTASGNSIALVERRATRRRLRPEIKANCGLKDANGVVNGSETLVAVGPAVVIPAIEREGNDGDGGGKGGGGSGGNGGGGQGGSGGGADDPLGPGGCAHERRGTPGPDLLVGGDGGDLILGLGGADRVRGGRGHDCLVGGPGDDRLLGDEGADRLTGGSGADRLDGGPGRNAYDAGMGGDRVKARNGRSELVRCGSGEDSVRADPTDRLRGCEHVARKLGFESRPPNSIGSTSARSVASAPGRRSGIGRV